MGSSILKKLSNELEELVAKAAPCVVGVEHDRGFASGFVLASDGYLVTSAHVFSTGFDRLRVIRSGGEPMRAELTGLDEQTDLAVLRVDKSWSHSLPLADRNRMRVGQLVVAIGNPLQFERSVSLGVISAFDRTLVRPNNGTYEGLIQTDAAINPGNSGGPLINVDGEVVGINTAVIPYAQGIGFAIPAQTAGWVTTVLINRGRIERPRLGIAASSQELDHSLSSKLKQQRAVKVYQVGRNSPAHLAGIHEGDWILSANKNPVLFIDDLQRIMVLSKSERIKLRVLRDQTLIDLIAEPVGGLVVGRYR